MANKDFKVKNGLDISTPLPVSMGGTGQTSTTNTLNALLPSQPGNENKVLKTDGQNTSWVVLPNGYTRGSTASRPASPTAGDLYFNTDYNYFESYTENGWFPIAAAPLAPTGVTATNQGTGRAYNNGQASVSFTPNTGGGAPSSFIVTPSPSTSPSTFTGSSSPVTVTGLSSSTQYTYTVQATSPYGTSSASSASAGVTATTVPQAPTIGTATSGNATATLTFTAGATGGSAITNYKYSTDGSTYTAFSPAQTTSPLSFTGLSNGTSYAWYLKAVNANGDSSASSISNSVTPIAELPDAYESIATIVVSSDTPSVTFNSIPNTYKHLQIIGMAKNSEFYTASASCTARFNGDTGNNYAGHYSYTNGTITIGGNTGWNNMYIMEGVPRNYAGAAYSGMIWDILDYADTSKWKTSYAQSGYPNTYMMYASNLWMNTSAVSSITITAYGGFNHVAGTFFALYGIKG